MIKEADDRYVPHSIKVEQAMALGIRQDIILAMARCFQPSLFLVDKTPLGLKREVVPTLRWLRENSPETRVDLGLHDIMDSAESTVREWRKKDIYGALENLYSEVWVYGNRDI